LIRAALDTNILVYAQGLGDDARIAAARSLIARAAGGALIVPVQALGELFRVLVRKGGMEPDKAAEAVARWRPGATVQDTTSDHEHRRRGRLRGLQIWDAVMLAGAEAAGADLLLTEDVYDGFVWRGVTVSNPFAPAASKAGLERFLVGRP
jgi:predicted nucleic acid-binding protein